MQAHHPRKPLPTGTLQTDPRPPVFLCAQPIAHRPGALPLPLDCKLSPAQTPGACVYLSTLLSLPSLPSSSLQQTPTHPSSSRCHLFYSVISVSCLYCAVLIRALNSSAKQLLLRNVYVSDSSMELRATGGLVTAGTQ